MKYSTLEKEYRNEIEIQKVQMMDYKNKLEEMNENKEKYDREMKEMKNAINENKVKLMNAQQQYNNDLQNYKVYISKYILFYMFLYLLETNNGINNNNKAI